MLLIGKLTFSMAILNSYSNRSIIIEYTMFFLHIFRGKFTFHDWHPVRPGTWKFQDGHLELAARGEYLGANMCKLREQKRVDIR